MVFKRVKRVTIREKIRQQLKLIGEMYGKDNTLQLDRSTDNKKGV